MLLACVFTGHRAWPTAQARPVGPLSVLGWPDEHDPFSISDRHKAHQRPAHRPQPNFQKRREHRVRPCSPAANPAAGGGSGCPAGVLAARSSVREGVEEEVKAGVEETKRRCGGHGGSHAHSSALQCEGEGARGRWRGGGWPLVLDVRTEEEEVVDVLALGKGGCRRGVSCIRAVVGVASRTHDGRDGGWGCEWEWGLGCKCDRLIGLYSLALSPDFFLFCGPFHATPRAEGSAQA